MVNLTEQTLYRLDNLNNKNKILSTQMATGRKLTVGSDDTQVYSRELFYTDKLRKYEGIKLKLQDVDAQNRVADDTMSEYKNILDKIKEELMKVTTDTTTTADKQIVSHQIKSLRDRLYELTNVNINNEYLFSGTDATKMPLEKDPTFDTTGKVYYRGDGYLRRVAVDANIYRDRNDTANNIIMYNTDTAVKGETLSFKENERIFDTDGNEWGLKKAKYKDRLMFTLSEGKDGTIQDQDGNEWKFNDDMTQLVNQNDSTQTLNVIHLRGNLFETEPVVTTDSDDDYLEIADGTTKGSDAIRMFNINGEAAKDMDNNPIELSVSDDGNDPRTYTTETLDSTSDSWVEGLKLMSKHNIFDDLQTIINALDLKKDTDTHLDDTTVNLVDISDDESDDILREQLGNIGKAWDAANITHGAIGERSKTFIDALTSVNHKITHYNVLIQENGAADLAAVSMDLKALEMTYTALYSTISKMNTLSLVNFLK